MSETSHPFPPIAQATRAAFRPGLSRSRNSTRSRPVFGVTVRTRDEGGMRGRRGEGAAVGSFRTGVIAAAATNRDIPGLFATFCDAKMGLIWVRFRGVSVVGGQLSVVSGQWSVVSCQWSVERNQTDG